MLRLQGTEKGGSRGQCWKLLDDWEEEGPGSLTTSGRAL